MRLSPDEIQYVARKIVKVLTADRRIEVDDKAQVVDGIARVIVEELQVEDRLNEEVREVLIQHTQQMDRSLSRERILNLSHLILRYMDGEDALEYFDEPQEIRQTIVRIITEEMRADEMIDALVRRKIESQKRSIPEGSSEWDVLYRKYFEEEVARHRKVMP